MNRRGGGGTSGMKRGGEGGKGWRIKEGVGEWKGVREGRGGG